MIRVVNKKTHKPTDNDVYVGRGSPLGNPYACNGSSHHQVTHHLSNRNECVDAFTHHLKKKIDERDPDICHAINNIIIKHLKGGDVNIVCYCSPDRCHGDIVKNYVENASYCVNWFSNMARMDTPLLYQGIAYLTVEHFYQAMKIPYSKYQSNHRSKIAAVSAMKSKTLIKTYDIRKNWDDLKLKYMKIALGHKFAEGTSWHKKLMNFDQRIVEWNNWNDTFWGVDIFTGKGENMLGEMITDIKLKY